MGLSEGEADKSSNSLWYYVHHQWRHPLHQSKWVWWAAASKVLKLFAIDLEEKQKAS